MMRILLLVAIALTMAGCAEMKVLGKATVRELTSDAINVERSAYELPEQLVEAKKVQVAKATQAAKQPERKKGLWERQ